jgi:hypothetical protein
MPSLSLHAPRAFVTQPQPLPQPTPRWRAPARGKLPTDRDFDALCAVYRSRGGVVRCDVLARVLNGGEGADTATLGRLHITHGAFSFEWQANDWVPMFQFDLHDMSIKPRPRRVVAEMAEVFDGWALAVWFAHPNRWLRSRRPIDLLDLNLTSVLGAARADRFIANG